MLIVIFKEFKKTINENKIIKINNKVMKELEDETNKYSGDY